METISQVVSTTSFPELVRVVWMELAMASFAATVYFTMTGYFMPKKVKTLGSPRSGSDRSQTASKTPLGRNVEPDAPKYQLVTKALRQARISDAITLLQEFPEVSAGSLPANIAPRLLMAAAKSPIFDEVISEMSVFHGKIEQRSFDAVVLEASKNKDAVAGRQLLTISCALSIPKSHQALTVLAKLLASDADCLRNLLEETEAPLPRPLAKAILEACAAMKDVDLAMEVFEKVADSDAAVLRQTVEKAAAVSASSENAREPSNCCKDIRACGKNGDLEGAIKIFEEQRKFSLNTIMYNSLMDACVECGNVESAVEYFHQARSSGLADTITYNTAMKGYLSQGKLDEAKSLLAEISEKGLVPTLASYHGILNFHINKGDDASAWQVVKAMQTAEVPPTAITCNILLKGKLTSSTDMKKVLELVDAIKPLDEVLFHNLAEACIRTGQLHMLAQYQSQLAQQGNSPALTAPTYGSMIKAYGHAHDVKHVWFLWEEMIKNNVQPTAITLGCMVEALVANWCTTDAWTLVQDMRKDESTRPLVNTVIYSTILKGFANAKETDKVMKLYEEMRAGGIQPNNITYNTILNAFAQGGVMDRVPALLMDMKKAVPPAEPDIVTYSTIVKGYCNSGALDHALEILKEVQSDGKFTPDEVLYNSLLDGCAKEHRPNEALKLLDDMKTRGVQPSNYTLSILVKLMGRCRRLNQAFEIIEDIRREVGLKVNIQVYTCLIQACFNNRQAAKAVALHDQIISEGLIPDEMTYSALVKGCLQAGLIDKAVHLTKCAHGLATPKCRGMPPGVNSRCLDELASALGSKSEEAKALFSALANCQVGSAKGSSKGKGKGKGKLQGK